MRMAALFWNLRAGSAARIDGDQFRRSRGRSFDSSNLEKIQRGRHIFTITKAFKPRALN
jgi:hypothetical protein